MNQQQPNSQREPLGPNQLAYLRQNVTLFAYMEQKAAIVIADRRKCEAARLA